MSGHYLIARGNKLNKLKANEVYNAAQKIFCDEESTPTAYSNLISKYGFVGMNKKIYSSASDINTILILSKKFNLSLVMMYFEPITADIMLEHERFSVDIPFYLPNIYELSDQFEYAFHVHNGKMEAVDREKAYELYSKYMKDYKCEAVFCEEDYSKYIKNEIKNKKRGSRIEERLNLKEIYFNKHIKGTYDYYKEGLNRLDKVSSGKKSGWYFVDKKLDVYKEYINVEREFEIFRSKHLFDEMNFEEWDNLYASFDDKLEKIRKNLNMEDEHFYRRHHKYIRFLNIIKVNKNYDLDNEYLILKNINKVGNQFLKNIQKALIDKNYSFENIGYDEYTESIEELLEQLNEHRRIIGRDYHYIEYDD